MENKRKLDQLKPGEECRIAEIKAGGATAQRLMDLGIIPGFKLKVLRNAPLVDPVELLVRENHVSIRHSEAKFIEVITE